MFEKNSHRAFLSYIYIYIIYSCKNITDLNRNLFRGIV